MNALLPRRLFEKNLHRWLAGFAGESLRRSLRDRVQAPRHVMFALCDHYEPLWPGPASRETGLARVRAWVEGYPRLAATFRDADGLPPRHTFFFPGEQYDPSYLESLAQLCRAGLGEVEFHLHHDGDTADNLRSSLSGYLGRFQDHGHLSRSVDGSARFAFIHGNWCLANARRDKRWCGVDEELSLLFEAGCYADFTFPAAPDEAQPGMVNAIYWPTGDLDRARSYEQGERARVGRRFDDRLLLIQGPLALARRPDSLRLRIENSAITAADPATPARVATWVDQAIQVEGRPDWIFVKTHTHGAPEEQARSLLGTGGRLLHHTLANHVNDGASWRLHYVTAREMYNIARAAMDGREGDPHDYRDYVLKPPPVCT
jgi:hypothetical protein